MLKLQVIGNLGGDATIKQIQTANGPMSVCNFSVASETGRGQNKETFWVRCDLFGRRAEALHQYLTKGTKVFVHGDLVVRTWLDNQSQTRVETEVKIDNLELLGGGQPQQQAQQAPNQQPGAQPPQQPRTQPPYQPPPQPSGYQPPPQGGYQPTDGGDQRGPQQQNLPQGGGYQQSPPGDHVPF